MKKKIIYHVEEWESNDSSCSYEFKTLRDAKVQAKKSLNHPSYGINAVKIWKCELLSSDEVK